jgi:hypothetical protein
MGEEKVNGLCSEYPFLLSLTDIIFSLQPFLRVTAWLASDRHLNSDLGLGERVLNVGHDWHTKLISA